MPRPVTAIVSLGILCIMLVVGASLPVPYVIEQPGPAIDVLGEYEDEQVITISGRTTYPTEGELMMTTVAVDGGPGYRVTPAEVIGAWFRPSRTVMPRELLFPADQTREQTTLQNTVQMTTSQQGAIAVALDELGIEYTSTVFIAGVLEGTPADGVLEARDEVLAINGESAENALGYQRLAAATAHGQPVRMRVRRDGEEKDLEVPTEVVDGAPKMGVTLADGYDFPIDVSISVGHVGGPSAGTMFALAIYDELTPGSLTGGKRIAGTGTIDEQGMVGPIGGIRQKMVGARAAGADYFLAPSDNCNEVVGHVPEDLHVVSVATFDDARAAVETIAKTGSTEGLKTCEES